MSMWTFQLKDRLPDDDPHSDRVAVAVGHELYCFGGEVFNRNQMRVIVFNTVTLCWKKMPPLKETRQVAVFLESHTAVLICQHVYIWGGINDDEVCNDVLYAFNVDTHRWIATRVSGAVPGGRWKHSACALGKDMYVFGGCEDYEDQEDENVCPDFYKLDTSSMVWTLIKTTGTRPHATSSHSATVIGTKMFVFGGRDSEFSYNTIRVFDTETDRWQPCTPHAHQTRPPNRWDHSAFAYDGELYVFGGVQAAGRFNDTWVFKSDLWKFNPEGLSWKRIKPRGKGPSPMRTRCCTVGHGVVLSGGELLSRHLHMLEIRPRLNTVCKLAVIRYGLEQAGLPHNIRWELAARGPEEPEEPEGGPMERKAKRRRTL